MVQLLPVATGFLPPQCPEWLWGPLSGHLVLSLAVKWLVYEIDLSPLWITRVNVWNCISAPPYVFYGVLWDMFYFTLFC